MLVGDGLIAMALSDFKKSNDILIFASGVSNSLANDIDNFDREKSLILSYKDFNCKLIYFSTCSIFDKTLINSPYVLHKKQMEQLISETFKNYCILRLPTLVGKSDNPNIFFNSFKSKLKHSEPITVFKNARRYLLAIDDIPLIIDVLLKLNKPQHTINVAFNNKASVVEIVDVMKKMLNSKSEIVLLPKGDDLEIDNREFIEIISSDEGSYFSSNFENIIEKYIYK